MKNVVYFLGAGFSAPLGLPVMANFLQRARNMHQFEAEKYQHFKPVLDLLSRIAVVKNHYVSDLSNIEEAFSILEMCSFAGSDETVDFSAFISDVIKRCTPALPRPERWPPATGARADQLFGGIWEPYGAFVLQLFKVVPEQRSGSSLFSLRRDDSRPVRYDIVSLNYDEILEVVARHTDGCPFEGPSLQFEKAVTTLDGPPVLAKLHGTVSGDIVPPTMLKAEHPTIATSWRAAHDILARANEVRVIGYSFPQSDAYVWYLLKSAAVSATNLQRIDVLDKNESAALPDKLAKLLAPGMYRHRVTQTEAYLSFVRSMGDLEAGHKEFMGDE